MSGPGTSGTPGAPGAPGAPPAPRPVQPTPAVWPVRAVQPEILDHLAPEDPEAQRSRRDLRRVNRLMGASGIIRGVLRPAAARASAAVPLRLLELGAGDGELLLRVARSLALRASPSSGTPPRAGQVRVQHSPPSHRVALWLLDRQPLVSAQTLEAYTRVGWLAQPLVCDVREWAAAPADDAHYDVIVANLFLHHFEGPALRALLAGAAARCECFLACEPRRASLALLGSHLLGAIGANRVTRHDAVLSVQAGFRDHELSEQWPDRGWQIEERAAGLFSHLFVARRAAGIASGQHRADADRADAI